MIREHLNFAPKYRVCGSPQPCLRLEAVANTASQAERLDPHRDLLLERTTIRNALI